MQQMYLKKGEPMEQGRNIFTIEYESGRIKEFEKKILAQGFCKSFLPMSFVYFGEIERVNYDCSGYQPIVNCEFRSSKEMIELLEKCIFALMDCSGYLINPKKIELNTETVFYSDSRKEVRFAYVPRTIPAEKALRVFIEFLEHIGRMVQSRPESANGNMQSKDIHNYLKSITSYIGYSNGSLFDVINYLGELKQEIHACG